MDQVTAQAAAAQAATLAEARKAEEERASRERLRQQWALPILNYSLSASFGQASRLWANRHTGQDFAAPIGTPVRAAHAGKITFAGWDGPYGKRIAIRHEDGTETWYCHLSAFVLTQGQVVPGETIGRVGNTGNSTGSHLHFEVRIGDTPVNPLTVLQRKGLSL